MAFAAVSGPASYRHNGADPQPGHMGAYSPRVAADGRIFLHGWVDRPYAATDTGTYLMETWAAATSTSSGLSDPVLYQDGPTLMVISGARWGGIVAHHGATGAELWRTTVAATVDATATIDPANGNIYVGAGSDDIWIVGLNKSGQPLWSAPSLAHPRCGFSTTFRARIRPSGPSRADASVMTGPPITSRPTLPTAQGHSTP
jgi:outer membrane protein assembly factor BamB